ncbi:M15 family metallopeptidase [Microbacterium sp. CFBP9034]|uniref:M15 family metallopeptidase n=1 Tax=Microbacterium sp. CFBP9034 TaxID=3096540 RepID=UPI002A699ACD|nr:M15 family metallopeptidase [Microbacterium sp. CFBP9034]MDY0910663.1 M15 family metallopeptidase [Microbacterium sp. CFBP9034]
MTVFPASPADPSPPRARASFLAAGVFAAAAVAVIAAVVVSLWSPMRALSAPFVPTEASGHLAESVALGDDDLPAIAKLNPSLRAAMADAAEAAAAEGVAFEVTSGWRSRDYQQWLLDDAIVTYGSEEVARRFVATPDRSSHVTGNAVDIGPLDAQLWLIAHGAQWGVCQIYANERWHFEKATDAGGTCPALRADAAG